MTNNCIECENETMLKYSALYCDYEDLQKRLRLTQNCLTAIAEMASYLAERDEELANKVKLYKEKCEELEKKNG